MIGWSYGMVLYVQRRHDKAQRWTAHPGRWESNVQWTPETPETKRQLLEQVPLGSKGRWLNNYIHTFMLNSYQNSS